MISVFPGQRWINHARPELGLGMVISTEGRTVTMRFGDEDRDHVFALESAPLSRIQFSEGDVIRTIGGARVAIETVEECDGILVYLGKGRDGATIEVVETSIAVNQSFNRPAERLIHGQIDDDRWFNLRFRTIESRHRLQRNPMWGLLGGRTALLPHQLYVAHEVAHRHAPRILLADEVGLGKTIEAGLIAHYQLVTERIHRVLIVVPEPLLHQWLVEMMRRFNLMFSVFDSERCDAMDESYIAEAELELDHDAGNPFGEEQLVLASREFLLKDPSRLRQCQEARWDLLIVDEAHHLHRDEKGASPAYSMVESLSAVSSGVLLLTGTPRQLGASAHYSRLRLLDPDRYYDADALETEHQDFEPIADLVEALQGDQSLSAEQKVQLASSSVDLLEGPDIAGEDREQRDALIDRLLDRYGTGRVMFRNTRASVSGFPQRHLYAYPLKPGDFTPVAEVTDIESVLHPDVGCIESFGVDHWMRSDPRVAWLDAWIKERPDEKALVICARRETAMALTFALKQLSGIQCAAFHEDLGIVERDRAAAWFADAAEGCQALICSEIGSEGRNFQFAHNMVLFDLPLSPDLLEQRIGRLDRIGRDSDVQIHVPYLADTPQARLFRWFHEGLNAFERIGTVNQLVFENLREPLASLLIDSTRDPDPLIDQSRTLREQYESEMRAGRDRLLEYHSCRPGRAAVLVEEGQLSDEDRSLRDWLELATGCYDITMEEYRQNSILLKPGPRLSTPIPGLTDDGLAATFDRNTALANEDLQFLSWEHPVVTAIADLVMNTERGNASVCGIRHPQLLRGKLAIECVFVVEAAVFTRPEVMRYVPPLLIPVIYDESGHRLDTGLDHRAVGAAYVPLKYKSCRQIVEIKRAALQHMLEKGTADMDSEAEHLLQHHGREGLRRLNEEFSRLKYLQNINPNVRQDEIEYHAELIDAVETALKEPRVRLDAIRVLVGL